MADMPEMVDGPNGRTLKVAVAITKRMKDGPLYQTYTVGPTGWRQSVWKRGLIVRCGNAGRGCRGVLGYLTSRYLALEEELKTNSRDGQKLKPWTIVHPDRFGGSAETGYRVLGADRGKRSLSGSRIGRAPMPSRLVAPEHSRHPGSPKSRRIVGQVPELPCIVFCPICGMPNWVTAPQCDAPLGTRGH